jgi:hypothetical protein
MGSFLNYVCSFCKGFLVSHWSWVNENWIWVIALDLRFSQQWLWRILFPVMWRHVVDYTASHPRSNILHSCSWLLLFWSAWWWPVWLMQCHTVKTNTINFYSVSAGGVFCCPFFALWLIGFEHFLFPYSFIVCSLFYSHWSVSVHILFSLYCLYDRLLSKTVCLRIQGYLKDDGCIYNLTLFNSLSQDRK